MLESGKAQKLLEIIEDQKREVEDRELEFLLQLAQELKKSKTEIPQLGLKSQDKIRDNLFRIFNQRKEKTMQSLSRKPFWKTWYFASAVTVLIVAVAIGTTIWFFDSQRKTQRLVMKGEQEARLVADLSFVEGDVEIKQGNQDWKSASQGIILKEGDSLKTGRNGKLILSFEDGSAVRVDKESEIRLLRLISQSIVIEQIKGISYHRVAKGTDLTYKVNYFKGTVTAKGTAFDIIADQSQNSLTVDVIEGTVNIGIVKDQKIIKKENIELGKKCILNFDEAGDKAIQIRDITKEELYTDWYKWNREQDVKLACNLGILEDITPPKLEITSPKNNSNLTTASVTVQGSTEKEALVKINDFKVENKDGQFSKTVVLKEGKNIIEVLAQDEAGNKTKKSIVVIYTKQEEQPAPGLEINLSGSAEEDGVHLWWTAYSGEDFKYYKVVRSEKNPNLVYPDDGYIKCETNQSRTEYIDHFAIKDHSYYYRVCLVKKSPVTFNSDQIKLATYQKEQTEIVCSNVIQITAINNPPSVSINLSVQAKSDGVHLSWTIDGTVPSGFKVVASEQANPTYPEASYKKYVSSETRSYIWIGLPHKTLHFRVGAYSGGICYAYSNDVTATPVDENNPPAAVEVKAKIDADGVHFVWTKSKDDDFKWYKLVRSETNPKPTYPADGYIYYTASRDQLTYLDKEVTSASSGTYYYSVCVVDSADQVTCSNVITVKDGVI